MNGPGSVQSLEEAAAIASEFISSLDNLPSEVAFLLNEIRVKDQKCADIQADIQRDSARYFKHTLKHSNGSGTTTSSFDTLDSNNPTKYAHIPDKIRASYDELDTLSDEKLALAKKLTTLLTRHQLRLHVDLAKVAELQGELLPPLPISGVSSGLAAGEFENVRLGLTSVPDLSTSAGPPLKKLKTSTSMKPPAIQLSIKASRDGMRSRPSRSSTYNKAPTPPPVPIEAEMEMDAEGEEENGEEEDTNLYCFCHKQSYGDMIGCDNDDCLYQWFHLDCVGESMPLPDKWYCPDCRKTQKKKKK